jgi:glucose/arabinose dehydrogenase
VAETEKLVQYDLVFDDKEKIYRPLNPEKILDLPKGGRHFTRTLLFLPYPQDHKLLISVGSTCDVCFEKDERNGTILVYDFKTKESKIYAKGLRNSVFLTLHPVTGKVWATEMGRDWLGDDLPPDEINIIEEGKNYGWPICYGKNIHDDNFDKNVYIRNPCMEPFETPSYIDIPAHSSPLGLAFFPEEGWPEDYWYNLLVAYHGSWNRTVPTGYKIVRYILDSQGNYLGEEDFITGWLQENEAIGRPVDILIKPGGIIYISDDKAGVIYKVVYKNTGR